MADNFNFKNFLVENKLGAYSRASKLAEKDTIYGQGPDADDYDYDAKGDAERTGAKFVPHEPRQPRASNFSTSSSETKVLDNLVKKMALLNRVAIDKYKYAKKENRPAAKEELYKTVKYMLGSSSRYADRVMKGLLQPIHNQWANYTQSTKQPEAFQEAKVDRQETGLYVIGRTPKDNTEIGQMIEDTGLYAEWNARDGYWFFPEEPEHYDQLEADIEAELGQRGINARFEGIHTDTKNDYFNLKRKADY